MTPRPPKIHAPLEYEFDEVLEAIADEFKPGIKSATARPFVKWAGGKRSIVPELLARMPETYKTYCELFLGGAALYYAVRPQQSYLSDINFPLVLTYLAVRDKVDELIAELKIHATKHNKDYYYKQRIRLSQEHTASKIGALLIYLNKSCYNGLYRVNKSGEYNVPMGSYTDPAILDEENLRAASQALKGAEIHQHPFSQAPIREGNFYYLDPPYHKTFSSYDGSGFGDKDHQGLAQFCKRLDTAGAHFMLSNSDTPFIRKLYAGYNIEQVQAGRFVSCKGTGRGKETELIIRNYHGRRESPADGQSA